MIGPNPDSLPDFWPHVQNLELRDPGRNYAPVSSIRCLNLANLLCLSIFWHTCRDGYLFELLNAAERSQRPQLAVNLSVHSNNSGLLRHPIFLRTTKLTIESGMAQHI